jgi:hypothetical protein
MTTYAEVQGTTLILYPYLFSTLQEQNPSTNFGDNYDVAYWFPQTQTAIENNYSLAPVTILPQPGYDPSTEICVQDINPTLLAGVWTLGWTVTTMTPEQKDDYDQTIKDQNKQQAMRLLASTDWTAFPSVGDPAQSDPYLVNQSAFVAYRSQVRAIAVTPPTTLVTEWPTLPTEQWSV